MRSFELTLAAEEDLRGLWRYTLETWGSDQADKYLDHIEACCDAIGDGRAQSRSLPPLPDGVCCSKCQHHYIFWLLIERPIIIAILHEKMDVVRRLADRL